MERWWVCIIESGVCVFVQVYDLLVSKYREPPVSTLTDLELKLLLPAFSVGPRDPNLGLLTCMADTLLRL